MSGLAETTQDLLRKCYSGGLGNITGPIDPLFGAQDFLWWIDKRLAHELQIEPLLSFRYRAKYNPHGHQDDWDVDETSDCTDPRDGI